MSVNAKPKHLRDNIFLNAVLSATDTDSDTQYNVSNIIDYRNYTFWKAASSGTKYLTGDLVENINGGFESGSTGYIDNGQGTISYTQSGTVHTGIKALDMEAAADNPTVQTVSIEVDADELYKLSLWRRITSYTSGDLEYNIIMLDDEDNTISAPTIDTFSSTNVGWVLTTYDIGPGGDEEFPAGTKSIQIQFKTTNPSTLRAFIDDILFYKPVDVNALGILGHNFHNSNASVSVESSDDDDWAITSWTERLSAFTPDNNKAFAKALTEHSTARAWRIKIVTANMAAFAAAIVLGPIFTYEKYPGGNFDPNSEKIISETNKSLSGYPLGTIINHFERLINISFRLLTPSWVTDTFDTEWEYLRQGLPVFWMWDITNHPTEVYYGSVLSNFTRSMPYDPVKRSLNLRFNTIVED